MEFSRPQLVILADTPEALGLLFGIRFWNASFGWWNGLGSARRSSFKLPGDHGPFGEAILGARGRRAEFPVTKFERRAGG